jgi:hypothetical protein
MTTHRPRPSAERILVTRTRQVKAGTAKCTPQAALCDAVGSRASIPCIVLIPF